MRGICCLALLIALAGLPCAQALDGARDVTGIERARSELGLSGDGVVIGVIDRGIDVTHPGFRTASGATRIHAMLDLTDDTGATALGNRFGRGTVYTRDQINAALRGGKPLPTDDNEGRGTANAGTACGNGAGSKDARLRGVAFRSTILFVKLKGDPPDWKRSRRMLEEAEKAEAKKAEETSEKAKPFFDLTRLRVAIDFCLTEARALKQPVVILMNFGQVGGPTDGGSKLCRKIDAIAGAGKPGIVFVTGSSDKGDRKNRAKGRVPKGGIFTLPVEKEADGEVIVDIWYPGSDRFDVSIKTPGGSFGPFKAPKTGKSEYGAEFQYYHLASSRNAVLTLGGKRQIRVDLIGAPGKYAIQLHGAEVKSGHFDAFIGPNPENPMQEPFNKFLEHATPGAIWDGATAKNAICVGCYVLRSEWTNIRKRSLSLLGEGKKGEIWLGSGAGPTADGRRGVTLCAPADRIATAYARKSEFAKSIKNVISDDGGLYGLTGGTSAAASLVAGVCALMLELDPLIDAARIKKILEETARKDTHTGAVPNATWGHGKLDAYAALSRIAAERKKKKGGRPGK